MNVSPRTDLIDTALLTFDVEGLHHGRLVRPFDALQWMQALDEAPDLAESIDAFCARFGRLQDSLGDKLLPRALTAQQERVGGFLDNLQTAQRLGWISDTVDFVASRKLRNRLVHDYSQDLEALAALLDEAHALVPFLAQTQARLAAVLAA